MVRTFLQHVDVLVVTVFETDVLFFHVSFTFPFPHSFYFVTVSNVSWANTSLAKRAFHAQTVNITMFEETNVKNVLLENIQTRPKLHVSTQIGP